jgi:hypothetical protein
MRRAVFLLLAFASACASERVNEVTPQVLARLPQDSRAAIYEAENDVTIARNRRDDAEATMEKLRSELDALEQREDHAKARS